MFNTELIRALQSHGSEWLTVTMLVISAVGSMTVHQIIVAVVLLGLSLRKGFILAHMLFWASTLTDELKLLFGLPRPSDVDFRVQNLWGMDCSARGVTSLRTFNRIHNATIDLFGSARGIEYGFPSGHVSTTTAVWGGLAASVRKAYLIAIAGILITLMAVSRMYLGRHFLGDVLGGVVLGGAIVLGASLLLPRLEPCILQSRMVRSSRTRFILALFYLFVAPFVVSYILPSQVVSAGRLLGMNGGMFALWFGGIPEESGSIINRAMRVVIGMTLSLATHVALFLVLSSAVPSSAANFLAAAGGGFVLVWAAVRLCEKIGLYGMHQHVATESLG